MPKLTNAQRIEQLQRAQIEREPPSDPGEILAVTRPAIARDGDRVRAAVLVRRLQIWLGAAPDGLFGTATLRKLHGDARRLRLGPELRAHLDRETATWAPKLRALLEPWMRP